MNENQSIKTRRLFRIRVFFIAILSVVWVATLPLGLVYVVPDCPYGPIADGGSGNRGYEDARAYGLSYGCVVYQTIRRTHDVGLVAKWQDPHVRLIMFRENVEGTWCISTSGGSLLMGILALAATAIPCRRRTA